MTNGWIENKIVDILATKKNAIAMGPFGSRIKKENFVSHGVPVIKGGNLTDRYLIEDNFDFLTEEKADELRTSMAFRGDIVITHRGTIGQVGLVPEDSKYEKYIVSQSQLKFSLDTQKADPYFVFYFFKTRVGQNRLLQNASQVGVPAIARASSSVKDIFIPTPPLLEQKRITSILRALDDKIENNRRVNETLEEMARAIFKSWFVDFDPVHAKAAGNAPAHMDADTATLFPSSFGDDGLPLGWAVKKIEDVMELAYGKALKASDRTVGEIPVYGSGGITGSHNDALVEGPSVIVGRKGTVGSLFWEDRSFFPIDTTFYLKPKINLTFCYYLLQTLKLDNMNTDAAVPGLNRNNVYRLEFIMPSQSCLSEFQKIVGLMRQKIRSNCDEAKTLAELRDTLLPKLMSGEIRVADAEREVEAAV